MGYVGIKILDIMSGDHLTTIVPDEFGDLTSSHVEALDEVNIC